MNPARFLRQALSPIRYIGRAYEREWRRLAAEEPITLVLVYHRVVPDEQRHSSMFGIESGVSASTFDSQLRFLCKHFQPIKPSEVMEVGEQRLRFAVTLDDGYEDNFKVAAPLMRRLGVYGGFYVVSDFVGTNRLFWWEQLAQMMHSTREATLDIASTLPTLGTTHGLPSALSMRSDASRKRAYELLSSALRNEPAAAVAEHIESLSGALRTPVREEGRGYSLMNWQQLGELARQGFEIGGHSATHCNLAGMAEDRLRREVAGSIADIQRQLSVPVKTFAYPYGSGRHYDKNVVTAVKAAGCKIAFTAERGVAGSRFSSFCLPRFHLSRSQHFACAFKVDSVLAL